MPDSSRENNLGAWAHVIGESSLDLEAELDFYAYLKDTGFIFKGCTIPQLQAALEEWGPSDC